jgi:FlaA1/EpsC-like NDP-sugar epimerase
VIFCVYENEGKPAANWQSYSRNCVADYVEHTKKKAGINPIIDQLIETKEEIIVWGTGNYTSRLLANSGLDKCNIAIIVDNDKHKQGTVISGKTVYPPNAIHEMRKTSTILIVAAVFCDDIVAEIRRMGLDNKIIVLGNGKGRFV